MADFLTQEWLDLQREGSSELELSPEPELTAVIQHLVSGAPDGNVDYTTTVSNGRVTEASLGKVADPDLTFQVSYEDAQRIARGELEAGAAFMQGNLKADGDLAKLFVLLELSHQPAFKAMVTSLAKQTNF